MHNSKNSPNSVDADFDAKFDSVTALVDETAAAAPIAEEGGFSDCNGGTTGGRHNNMGEVMFIVVSASSLKRNNSVKKVILQYCFEADNDQRAALTEWALEGLVQKKSQRDFKK